LIRTTEQCIVMDDDKVLLDYYTKSMTVHATITVAVAFGLFSLLGIISRATSLVTRTSLTGAFFILILFGWYEIKRYEHYGNMAKNKAKKFRANEGEIEKGVIGLLMTHIFPKAGILFVVTMISLLVFVWLGFFV